MKRIISVILTLVMVMSCMTGMFVIESSAVDKQANYLVISGTDLANANERYGVTTTSTANGVWAFTTTNNDPYVNTAAIAGVGETVLRTYPYVVVRYKTNQFTSMEIFSGHPGTAARRVSLPAPATNGQWGCLFYDFSQFPDQYKSWFRLEVATASGISMEIAEVVLFKNAADVATYRDVYVKAGAGGCEVLTFNDFGFHGNGVSGRTANSGDVSGITEVRPDNNEAMFNEGGYFTRLTSGGPDGWIEFKQNNGAATNGVKNFSKVAVRYRAKSDYNGRTMQLFFAVDGAYSETNSSKATIVGDDSWQWAFFNNPLKGSANSLRFDYMSGTGYVDVAEVYFYNSEADIYSASVGANSYRNNPGHTWFNGDMYMLHKSTTSYFQSVGTVAGGQYKGYQQSGTGAAFAVGNQSVTTVGRTFYKQAAYHSAHNENTQTVVSTPTCSTAGSTQYSCSLCGAVQRTVTTGTTGHTPGAAATCTTAQTCTVCGATIQAATGHTVVVDPYVAPTPTTPGLTQGSHCGVCNVVLVAQQTIPPTAPDPNAPTLTVGTVSGEAGDTVVVPVVMTNNPGIYSFTFSIEYDTTRLTLTDASLNLDGLGGSETIGKKVVWLGDEDDSMFNGEIMYMTFQILADAPAGDAAVTVSYRVGDVCNYDEEDVNFTIVAGGVTVAGEEDTETQPPVVDPTEPSVTVGTVSGAAGETVVVPVVMANNPGIYSFTFSVEYDTTRLNLTNASINIDGLGGSQTIGKRLVWLGDDADSTFNGEILYLTFEVLADAPAGTAAVTVSYNAGDICNYDEEDVDFTIVAGGVTIGGGEGEDTETETQPPIDPTIPAITVGTVSGVAGDTVVVPVVMANNPGIYSFTLTVNYDTTRLNLVSASLNLDGLGGSQTIGKRLVWLGDDADSTFSGEIVYLTFEILADAPAGKAAVSVSYNVGDICNYDEEDVDFALVAGGVTVGGAAPVNPLLSTNVALGENFAINVKFTPSASDVITVTCDGVPYTSFVVVDGKITISNIAAKDMDKEFVVTVNGFSTTVSVNGYCEYQVENATDAKLVAVAESALLYNAAAKNYFGEASEVISVDYCDVGTDNPRVVENADSGVTFYSVRLQLVDAVKVVVRMKDYADETITVTIDGYATEFTVEDVNGMPGIVIPVHADQFDADIVIKAGDSTLTYSVNTYIQQKQTDANADLVNLVNALGWYGKATQAYVA